MFRSTRFAIVLGYGLMLGASVVVFLWVRTIGERRGAGGALFPAPGLAAGAGPTVDTVSHVLLALAAIIVTAQVMRQAFKWIGQPAVVGEIVGGIMLGPSLLGRVAPGAFGALLPPSVAPFLGVHAQIGIILYMFLVGLDLDLGVLQKSPHATVAISHASIVVPFLAGAVLALFLAPTLSLPDVPFTVFALFIGVSLSITAFPVLARILTDRGLHKTPMGTLALACAAVDDVTAWCLLALVVAIAHAQGAQAAWTVSLTVLFIAVMFGAVRPLVKACVPAFDTPSVLSVGGLGVILVALLMSAMVTEYIGIHGIFGAFLFGAIVPHDAPVAAALRARLDALVAVLFLPAFFAFTGLRTHVWLLDGSRDWLVCAAIVLVACIGKFSGTFVAARLAGLLRSDAAALGVLMNTRGLVELIALNIGLDLGVISPRLFTMLVVMALATTFMTTPALYLILRRHPWTA
jgi:Kef-type K+ transport system membrane component KefB